ncbi:hypothetical protein J5N58_17145 [Rhizobium cremeum]|uniref:hypothetical protein n=1 Tax=Rhizobium cremeum TaxID=2813827 RepID=UPI000DE0403B|nr:hypothetical protein [Rhizobium cremeum]MCJ7996146.1 hypothetical protein [Rhizobium cremeum]MCJ8001405.1 hypothetical protein [Rhizobium cremeum]
MEYKNKRSVFDYLQSIDKKLELIVKFIGYFSIFIITPSFFLFAKFGLDIKEYFYGRELSEGQKEIVALIKSRGYEANEEGALLALRENSPLFVDYIRAEILPESALVTAELLEVWASGHQLNGDSEVFKGWLRKDPAVLKDLRPALDDANQFINRISVDAVFGNVSEVCVALGKNVDEGAFGYAIGQTADCQLSFVEGTIGVYLSNLIKNTRYWNELVGIAQPPDVPTENVVRIATLADLDDKASERQLTPITPDLFDDVYDGRMYRFKVDAREYGTLAQIEYENAYRLAVVNQDVKLKKKEVFKIRLFRNFSDEWYYKYCRQGDTCLIDFNGIFFDNKVFLTKVNGVEAGDEELWAYVDNGDDWSDSK